MYSIVRDRFRYFFISLVLIALSVAALLSFGLKPSIEFSSGTLLTLSFTSPPTVTQLKGALASQGYGDAIVQTTSTGDFLVRVKELDANARAALEAGLQGSFGTVTERSVESIDPIIARQTTRYAIIGVAVAAVAIMLYMAWAFRKMPHPIRYGACAVIALVHDIIITAGIFAFLGRFLHWEIDLMFVTGILAILGYSVNNTVVVYDRIRENRLRGLRADFEETVNDSVLETLTRSFNTSFTTIITIVAVLLFVGATVQNFTVVLLIGILVGLFDSAFIAPALLVVFDKGEWGRFIGRGPKAEAEAAA